MRYLISCTFITAMAASPARAGVEVIDAPIVGGRLANASELFATVALVDAATGEANCTGTLVAPRVVVTAAHCLAIEDEDGGPVTGIRSAGDIAVVAGVLDVTEAGAAETYEVSAVIVHEGYPNESPPVDVENGAGRYDDIGLLLLARDVDTVAIATVPSIDEGIGALEAASSVIVTGYGATSADTDETGVLFIAEVSYGLRADAEIVLGGPGEPDTCPGDSGGPAYIVDGAALWLVGATSRASQSAQASCGDGGIYGLVPFYRDWIVANAAGLYTIEGDPVDPEDPEDLEDPEDPEDPTDPDEDDELDEGCAGGASGTGLAAFAAFACALIATRAATSRHSTRRRG